MRSTDALAGSRYASKAPPAHPSPGLRERYETYCRDQGRELLNLLPREGVRSLLKRLRDTTDGPSALQAPVETSAETLERLADLGRHLLPLPPFEVWVDDFHKARAEYATIPGPPLAPEAADGQPVTVDVRPVTHAGDPWVAGLALRPLKGRWVGHIRFHRAADPTFVQTGEIFRAETPVEVRERFREFEDRTLLALLRSVLP